MATNLPVDDPPLRCQRPYGDPVSSNEPDGESGNQPGTSKRFLTRAEVAEQLNISEAQVYALLRRGELRAIRVGGRKTYRIARTDLETFIEAAYRDTEQWLREHPFDEGEAGSPGGAETQATTVAACEPIRAAHIADGIGPRT